MSKEANNLQQRRNCTLTAELEFEGKSINTNKEKGQSCIEEVLAPIHAHLEDMKEKHSKVMVTRFDLRIPSGAEELNNHQVGRIAENMSRAIKRKEYAGGHNPDPRIVCAAENHGSGTHYHCVAMVNGNAIQNPHTIYNAAEKYLGKALKLSQEETKGLVDYCNQKGKNGIIIKHGSSDEQEKTNQVMHQVSYLAKERGKEQIPKGQHLVIGTRVPKDN